MKIIQNEIVTWEPLTVALRFTALSRKPRERVRKFVISWLKRRQTDQVCGCELSELEFHTADPNSKGIVFQCEWTCETCTQALADALKHHFPQLREFRLGLTHEKPRPTKEFLPIPGKRVRFENSAKVLVKSFWISRQPISVGQFERFCSASGYVTTAERNGDFESFKDNQTLSGSRSKAREALPAYFVSYQDALAYCKFSNVRLPTEAEWLAASIIDFNHTYRDGPALDAQIGADH